VTTATIIPTPIVASTPGLAAALKAEPAIQQVLKQACAVQQAIVGVGTPTADATIVQMGYLAADDVRHLREHGVVGDILGQFFDADGNVVNLPIHDRRIGIELSDLAPIPKVVGVAGGMRKAEAILGALHGGFLTFWSQQAGCAHLLELERRFARAASGRCKPAPGLTAVPARAGAAGKSPASRTIIRCGACFGHGGRDRPGTLRGTDGKRYRQRIVPPPVPMTSAVAVVVADRSALRSYRESRLGPVGRVRLQATATHARSSAASRSVPDDWRRTLGRRTRLRAHPAVSQPGIYRGSSHVARCPAHTARSIQHGQRALKDHWRERGAEILMGGRIGESIEFYYLDTSPMLKFVLESGSGHAIDLEPTYFYP
jgi:hypothetical protein